MAIVDIPESSPCEARVRVLMVVLGLGLLAIVARLWYLQIAHGDELFEASVGNQLRLIRRIPPRGEIVDRGGLVLATDRPRIVVSVVPDQVDKPGNGDVLARLSDLLGMPEPDIRAAIADNKTTAYDPVRVAVDVDLPTATRLEEQRSTLPGVVVGPEPIRYYPDGPMCGHLLGQLGQVSPEELAQWRDAGYRQGDYCGKLGLERVYDRLLRGTNGGREIEVDARGRMRRVLNDLEPIPGDTLTLNLDKKLQRIAYDALADWARQGHPGAVVALDPQTGGVLAMASVPSYDPNEYVSGVSRKYVRYLATDPLRPQINRAVGSGYAPGSTFKMITAAAALMNGVIAPTDTIYCSGVYPLGRWRKHCWRPGGHGSVALVEAIQKSCDVYFYTLGRRLGPDRLAAVARRFGLGQRTGVDLPRVETSGVVPDPAWKAAHRMSEWVPGESVDYGIGQAMLKCSPIQMCNMAAAIGNGGTLYQPQMVKSITRFDAAGHSSIEHRMVPKPVGRLGLPPHVLALLQRGMEEVMEPGGTGTGARVPGVTMAGKTGTAQMMDRGHMVNNAWFVTYAPAQHPRIAICVFVQGAGHGGTVGAPIARKMYAQFFGVKTGGAGSAGPTD